MTFFSKVSILNFSLLLPFRLSFSKVSANLQCSFYLTNLTVYIDVNWLMEKSFKCCISNIKGSICVSFNSTFYNQKTCTLEVEIWKLILYLILTKNHIIVNKVYDFQFNNYISRKNRGNEEFGHNIMLK